MISNRLKAALKPAYHRLPLSLRAPQIYWKTLELLNDSVSWDEQRIREYQTRQLRTMLGHCANNVPYYKTLFRKTGFDPEQMRDPASLRALPRLDIETLRERPQEFLATNIDKKFWMYSTTGGTLGRPLGLYNLRDSGWRERAFIEHMWSRAGFRRESRRAVLRGTAVTQRKKWFYDANDRAFVFSNFDLTPESAVHYAEIMKSRQVGFLHCYPSSMVHFGRYLQELGCDPPNFHAVLAGSENIDPGQEEFAQRFYGCRMFIWMGHSENVILAGGCELNNLYHVSPEYGYVELLREDGTPVEREGEAGELVGTSFYNRVMPLVRYRSGDWAMLGPEACSCGRKHRLLRKVEGRRDQEMLIGSAGNRISFTAINMHSALFDRVRQFQFHQREPGKAELKIVKAPGYTEQDSRTILREMSDKMGATLELELKFVDEIPLTGRGKFRFIVQDGQTNGQLREVIR